MLLKAYFLFLTIITVIVMGLIGAFFEHAGLQFGLGTAAGLVIAFTIFRIKTGYWL
jgi:uncharacterized membrane protein YccC